MKLLTQRNIILITIVVGVSILSAMVGALVAGNSLDRYAESLEQIGKELGVVTSLKPPSVPSTTQEAMLNVLDRSNQSSMSIVNINDPIHKNGVVASRTIGTATSLTTDGWALVPKQVVQKYGKGARIMFGGELFKIEEFILDPQTEFGFAKTNIKNARVGTFGVSSMVATGDTVFIVSGSRVYPRTIIDSSYYSKETGVLYSDELERMLLIDHAVETVPGGMLMNTAGELIGMLVSDSLARPLHHITPAFEDVLLNSKINRPELGIGYVDVSRVLYSGDNFREGFRIVSVAKNSIAEDAGIKIGDVIVKIQGNSVNERPLSEYIATGKSGDQIQLHIVRDKTEEEIFVTIE